MPTTDLPAQLTSIGQSAVLRFADRLDAAGRAKLTAQLQALDLPHVAALADEYVKHKPHVALPKDIRPVKAFPRVADAANAELYKRATATGHDLIAAGKVAAFLVAGGQGTRLGYDGPKGEYPVTPVKAKPLFQVFAEQLLNYGKTFGKPVPWYLMTSDVNDAATRAFFGMNDYFGLRRGGRLLLPAGHDAGLLHGRPTAAGRQGQLGPQPRRPRRQPGGPVQERRDRRHEKARRRTPVLLPGRQPAGSRDRPAVHRPARHQRQPDEHQDDPQGRPAARRSATWSSATAPPR